MKAKSLGKAAHIILPLEYFAEMDEMVAQWKRDPEECQQALGKIHECTEEEETQWTQERHGPAIGKAPIRQVRN